MLRHNVVILIVQDFFSSMMNYHLIDSDKGNQLSHNNNHHKHGSR